MKRICEYNGYILDCHFDKATGYLIGTVQNSSLIIRALTYHSLISGFKKHIDTLIK